MGISTVNKFPYDIPTYAEAMGIPKHALKEIIRRVFKIVPRDEIPDVVNFVEESKAISPVYTEDDERLKIDRTQRLILNGEGTITIGLRPGEGTTSDTVHDYIEKAGKSVFDLSPWT